ncbi:hypothetical protein QYF61_026788 [Mycteria americana]|uniref:Uncharacterized protein n=1 Tax=Mycteria americana TaxID=33587 RepID=A0AAN7NWN4_MYCAM|nr:hypothetical protein QYF61_026788 [Mycteria americana]
MVTAPSLSEFKGRLDDTGVYSGKAATAEDKALSEGEEESTGAELLSTVRGPKLNTVFEVRPHQCRVQGHDHFPSPAGHTTSDTSQDAVGLLGHLGTLLAQYAAGC